MDDPIIKITRTQTAQFISDEGSSLHQGLATGWSQYTEQRASFENPKPYITLENILRAYVPSALDIDTTDTSWETLYDRLSEAETEWQSTGHGARGLFATVWMKIGENRELVDPWINLIPDNYGLAVVKMGVAVVFKLAAHSVEKRQRIYKTFEGIKTTIVESSYKRRSFQTDGEVSRAARELYFAVVEAVEGLLCGLSVR
ncbi:hypothetical protein BO71DRAFT_441273, partial [Aspergillus ellipticus CBS 707.79]